jgi:hypothetical protein
MGMACLIKLVYVYFDGGISRNTRPSTLKQQFVLLNIQGGTALERKRVDERRTKHIRYG